MSETTEKTNKLQWAAIAFLSVVVCLMLAYMLLHDPFPQSKPIAEDNGVSYYGGWNDDPEARDQIKAKLAENGQVYFGDTPAGRAFLGNDNEDVLLTDAAQKALGHWIPVRDQGSVGSCVSFGVVDAVEHLFCVQMVNAKRAGQPPPIEYKELVQEAVYGGSRVEVGGGRIRGDGSVTAWAAQWLQQKGGALARGKYGSLDLSNYDVQRCREWGTRGVPDNLEPIARESPVKGITFVRNAEEAWKAIGQGYPIAVGSSVGFGNRGPWTRDADGFLKASGQWGHCMSVVGRATIKGQRAFLFKNSWGPDVHKGPKGGKNIPDSGCFFVVYSTADRMFKEGDAIAFSDAVGFPVKNNFFINHDGRFVE